MSQTTKAIDGIRALLYGVAKALGDIAAVKRNRVGKRIGRRVVGRMTGKAIGRLFRR